MSQTALDLVAEGHAVYVLADGVSSSHHAEAKVALDRLSRAGVIITTSEAWLYECMGNANIDKYVIALPWKVTRWRMKEVAIRLWFPFADNKLGSRRSLRW